ncbi:hypothetical protein [Streptosporangium sp. NPDC003464]
MRTAISAGALALALSGGIFTAAAASAAQPDCDNGGLLGGVTDGLCKAVDTVGDVVEGVTDAVAPPAAKKEDGAPGAAGASEETEEASVKSAEAPPPASAPSPSAPDTRAAPEPPADDSLLPKALDDVCLPLVASPECTSPSAISAPEKPEKTEQPPARPSPRPSPSGRSEPAERKAVPLPVEPLRPPETRTRVPDVGEPVAPRPSPVVDAEAPRVELLWPRPAMQEFQRRVQELQTRRTDGRPLRPTRSSDTLGTVLTTALLLAAILAVRLLYARRAEEESMPFEPLRMSRHRTA